MREKMEKGVRGLIRIDTHENIELAHLAGQLVGFDFSESIHVKGILGDAPQLTRLARQAYMRLLLSATQIMPMVLQLEDVHWADPASLELINDLVTENRKAQVLVVCTARPLLYEHRPTWGSERDLHRRIDLHPLSKRDSRNLVREILQKMDDVPKALTDLIAERAEGNPYYIE